LEKPNSFSDILQSWATFKAALKTTFGPVDQASISANAIRALKQGNRRVTAFAADFNLLASDLDFNEPALMHLFRHGLADNIKDMLLNFSEPTSMLEFITVAMRADQRLVEHNRDRVNRGHSVTAPNFPPKSPVTPTYPDSMDIDAVLQRPRGPLTPAERAHRVANRLCIVCGVDGHYRDKCPHAIPRTATVAAANLTGPPTPAKDASSGFP
jgi:hypothetical protein